MEEGRRRGRDEEEKRRRRGREEGKQGGEREVQSSLEGDEEESGTGRREGSSAVYNRLLQSSSGDRLAPSLSTCCSSALPVRLHPLPAGMVARGCQAALDPPLPSPNKRDTAPLAESWPEQPVTWDAVIKTAGNRHVSSCIFSSLGG